MTRLPASPGALGRPQEPQRAVAVQGAFDRIEEFVDKEDGGEGIWPGEKE